MINKVMVIVLVVAIHSKVSVMHLMLQRTMLAAFFLLAGIGNTQVVADEGLCCARDSTFLPVIDPPQLESNPMIDSSVIGTLREGSTRCDGAPIQYEELDWSGRQQLHKLVDAITATVRYWAGSRRATAL